MIGGIQTTTMPTAVAAPSHRRRADASSGWPRRASTQPTMPQATTRPTTGVVEMSVWTTKEPTSTAASAEQPEPSQAAATSTRTRSSGMITTIGFHGLTSAPRRPSE